MNFYFKDTKKDIMKAEEDEKDFRNKDTFRFCENNIESDKVGYHCHSTGKYRRPAHNTCNIKVTQKQNTFIPFVS